MIRASGRVFLLGLILAVPGAAKAQKAGQERTTKAGADFFEKEIRPILVQNCYSCHSGDPKKAKGGFLLDTREGLRKGGKSGSVINPGHPEQSLLIEAVQYESLEMPPKGKLVDELIEKKPLRHGRAACPSATIYNKLLIKLTSGDSSYRKARSPKIHSMGTAGIV